MNLYESVRNNLKESPVLSPEYSSRKSFYDKAKYTDDENGRTLRSYQTDIMRIKDGKIEMLCDENALTNTTLRHIKEFLLQNGMEPLTKQQLIKLINEKDIKESDEENEYYNWRDDIEDVTEWSSEESDDIFYRMGENLCEIDPDYYTDPWAAASDIIGLWRIKKSSKLYDYLLDWYGSEDELMKNVRDVLDTGDSIYFVTGCNYAIFDADLLGGNADGRTQKRFEKFIETGVKEEPEVVEESEKLKEADSQVVWSSETTEDDYDEEYLKEEYKDYVDGFASPDDAKSFEDWKYDYIADDSSDMWNIKEEDLKTNIYPMIDGQINNDILIISGNYNSNYPDFRPSGSGGKFLNKAEDILDWLSNEDRIDFYVENGNLGVKAYDHDGSIGGLLYTLPNDKNILLDLAKSTDYYSEDRTDEDILGELSYDLNHDYYDMSDFFKFSDKFVPIKWNL